MNNSAEMGERADDYDGTTASVVVQFECSVELKEG